MSDAAETEGRGWGRFVPLGIFCALGGVMGYFLISAQFFGYERDALPSALIGAPAPETDLPPLREGEAGVTSEMLAGPGVKIVNVWASWCGPCRVEHPQLMALEEMGHTVVGLNYRDDPSNALAFLAQLGDPYARVGVDRTGRNAVDWGVYGVPETFVVDGAGNVVHKHVGPIEAGELEDEILPAIEAAQVSGE